MRIVIAIVLATLLLTSCKGLEDGMFGWIGGHHDTYAASGD
jgi:hypothetical protein